MDFLISHGPVPVAIYMTQAHHADLHSKNDIITLPNTPPKNGWDYINHGVVIIGWGISEQEKFWEVYNPWGGKDTFARIKRDNGIIERNAIGIKVDTCKGKFGVDREKIRSQNLIDVDGC